MKAKEKKYKRSCLKQKRYHFFVKVKEGIHSGNTFITYMGTLRRGLVKLEHEEKQTQKKLSKLNISLFLFFFVSLSHFHGNFGLMQLDGKNASFAFLGYVCLKFDKREDELLKLCSPS